MTRTTILLTVIATAAFAPRGPEAGALPEVRPCSAAHVASDCLRPLDSAEARALDATLVVLMQSHDERCRVLGDFIARHAGDARIVPYPILTRFGLATADAHAAEVPAGSGRVHVADSVLTRDGAFARPVAAKVHSLVHDFAHLVMELPQEVPFIGTDPADDVAESCIS